MAGSGDRSALLERDDIQALERLSLNSLGAIVSGLFGQREGPGRSSGFEFVDYRRYTPGDDVRRIDWNIYARLQELYIRTAPQEASLSLSVLLDASRSMDSGEPNKLRYAKRLAALLGAVALLRSDAVELHSLSDGRSVSSGAFDSGGEAMGAMVGELERLPGGLQTQLAASIRRSAAGRWRPEMSVLITDGLIAGQELEAAVSELGRSSRLAAIVHLSSRADREVAWSGSTLLLDSETGRRMDAMITAEARRRYAERYRRLGEEIQRFCSAWGVGYLAADTARDPLEFLLAAGRDHSLVRVSAAS